MTDSQEIVEVLNELLRLEQASLPGRLMQSTMFVSRLTVADAKVVEDMARAGEAHAAQLAEAVIQLDGVSGPRITDTRWANLHYQDVRNLLPDLVTDRETLVQKYARALNHVGDEPDVAQLLTNIHARHEGELATLRQRLGQGGGQNVAAGLGST